MKQLLFAGLLLGGLATQAQQVVPSASPPVRPEYKPVWLLDSRTIIGDNQFSTIYPDEIKKIDVYKANNLPAKWSSLAEHGIVALTMKHRVKLETQTLSSLSHWLHLAGPVRFELDGLPLEDLTLRIATGGIAGLDITQATPTAPSTVINIRLVRTKSTSPRSAEPSQPGRIYIRGMAGL